MLPLYGVAQETRGFDNRTSVAGAAASLTRCGRPRMKRTRHLCAHSEDAAVAKASGFNSALAVGDDLSVG